MMKLSVDEKESLDDFLSSPALPVVIKVAEEILSLTQDRLINTALTATNEKEIFIMKSRIDGASVFLEALKQRLSRKTK